DADPDFRFNRDVPDVSSVHTARVTALDCSEGRYRIELADGRWFHQSRTSGALAEGPNAARIESMPSSGEPVVLKDNTAFINKVIENNGGGLPGVGCSCQTGSAGLLSVLGLGLVALRFRRRR